MIRYFNIVWNRLLGTGGEAHVYLAHAVTTGRAYAVKFHNALIPWVAQRGVRRELGRVLRVRGNYVARPVAWNLGPQPFVVYELAEFGSLRHEMNDMFSAGMVYHPRFALERAYQMLLGLREAHHAGLVHRDVKPDNYLLYANNVLKLSDFGVGRTLARAPSWQTNGFVGTWRYAAPEQVMGYRVDGRADLYSVGAVLYEMLLGAPPNPRVYNPLPSERYQNALRSLDSLCCRLLAWQRGDRPPTVDRAIAEVSAVWHQYDALRHRYNRVGLASPY